MISLFLAFWAFESPVSASLLLGSGASFPLTKWTTKKINSERE